MGHIDPSILTTIMDNATYSLFEAPFRDAARPLLEQLRDALVARGLGPFAEVLEIDRDNERGLGFNSLEDPDQFVDLMLTDHELQGAEGVGLVLTCSIYGSGQVWAPGNFTDGFSMASVEEVLDRLRNNFGPGEIADRIAQEWARMATTQAPRDRMHAS